MDQPASTEPGSDAPFKAQRPAAIPAHQDTGMEGGIVGTGNEDDCKNSENKEACNDNVK